MLDWTDRHCRFFHRLLSSNVKLYTEMVTTGAVIHGNRERLLSFNQEEHPVAIQLGGSDPEELAESARIVTDFGYDGINLNCGCPSDRVQKGSFGACLMVNPSMAAKCYEQMAAATSLPVTVKCRTGVDDNNSMEFLDSFISTVKKAGCRHFIIHARNCRLKGLSPKENREIPPLEYGKAGAIKQKHSELFIEVNGGIQTIEHIKELTPFYDGLMIGREAYQNPYFLADVEREIFGNENVLSREEAALTMIPYIERQNNDRGTPVKSITRHMTGLFKGQKGSGNWRRILATEAHKEEADEKIILRALQQMNT
jgi:tRNA-dihydrouridine synthase A